MGILVGQLIYSQIDSQIDRQICNKEIETGYIDTRQINSNQKVLEKQIQILDRKKILNRDRNMILYRDIKVLDRRSYLDRYYIENIYI